MKLKCSGCKKNLSVKAYHKERNTKRGYKHYCKNCDKAAFKRWRAALSPQERQNKSIAYTIHKYGLTFEDYQNLLKKQNGVCAICKKPELRKVNQFGFKRLAIDHEHFSNKVRGLLCASCNTSLGGLYNIQLLKQAIEYLKKEQR